MKSNIGCEISIFVWNLEKEGAKIEIKKESLAFEVSRPVIATWYANEVKEWWNNVWLNHKLLIFIPGFILLLSPIISIP